jgi:hypothetical protein
VDVLALQAMSTVWGVGVKPVPERGIDRSVVELLERVKVPATDPEAAGVNTSGIFTLCAGFRVIGTVMPVLKPVPVMLSFVMLAAPVPLLVTFTVNVIGVLITCDPKPRLEGVAVRLGEPGGTGVGLGVGVGLGPGGVPPLDLVAPPVPPQPIAHIATRTTKRRKTLEYLLAIFVLCNGNSSLSNTQSIAAAGSD